VACCKEWGATLALVALLALAAPMPAAQAASDVPCADFVRNPDGSWTAANNVAFPGPGRIINLRQGSVMKPGFFILGTDVAAELATACASMPVQQPQAEITTLADDKGIIDMATLTCGQLLSVYQEDADFLLAWYSGWSNGLAKSRTLNIKAVKDATHNVIVYCKANLTKRVGDAIDALKLSRQ
jgi:HdeA/HdeB family